jgi:competence protein ComEA
MSDPSPPDRQTPSPAAPARSWLTASDQRVAAVLLVAALVGMGVYGVWQGRLRGRLIEIDQAPPLEIAFQVDVNRATWPELALLPSIGEKLAKRIIADREANGPFRDFDDLRRVRGIGPLTLDEMRPYLVPLADIEATAGDAGFGPEPRVN